MNKPSNINSNSPPLEPFPILNPNPIIEADLEGNLIYLNEAAKTMFPDLEQKRKIQAIFTNWEQTTKHLTNKTMNSFCKESQIGANWFITRFFLVPNTKKIQVYFIPINELKQKKQELEKEKILLQTMMNCSNVHLVYLDRDFNFAEVNQTYAQACGYNQQEIIGKNYFDIYPNKEDKEIFCNARDTGMPIGFKDKPFNFANQQERKTTYWDWTLQPIKSAQGKVEGIVFSLVETTERKMFQIKLEYANQMEMFAEVRAKQLSQLERLAAIEQTASIIGHNIRNPLQSMVGELYLAKENLDAMLDCQSKKNLRENIDNIEEDLYYIDKIVADLQDHTKPLKPNKNPVEIERVIEGALLAVSIPSKLNVNITIEENLPKIKVDFPMLKHALTNLIQNAVQAMPNDGTLKITAQTKNNQVQISIQDTGEGISQEAQKNLFMPLFTTKAKGQGFGLAVVKRLIEAQDGKVTYETQKDEGTTFTIHLPL
ncbi:MAG: ATP-binding protein [Candidatus Bathyarchaeota archaeon]|nr:ATP-binding protein [Candidatus Termiticorpusculum sp.]